VESRHTALELTVDSPPQAHEEPLRAQTESGVEPPLSISGDEESKTTPQRVFQQPVRVESQKGIPSGACATPDPQDVENEGAGWKPALQFSSQERLRLETR